MIDPFYRKDPAFQGWNAARSWCRNFARSHGVKLCLVDTLYLEEWEKHSNISVVTNTIVLENVSKSVKIFRTKDSFYGVYYYPYELSNIPTPNKSYNCFINRLDPFRQSWFYQLIRRKILDQGFVSFNMDISRNPSFTDLTPYQAFEKLYNEHLQIFEAEHEFIKELVPYKNFVSGADLTDVILDSKFSIVLETYFHINSLIVFSEKTFRVLQLPRPWLLFAAKDSVKYLREMGFDVLDDLVDHNSYDHLDSAVDRQTAILDLAVKFIDKTFDTDRCVKAAQHNQSILQKYSLIWQKDFEEVVLVAARCNKL